MFLSCYDIKGLYKHDKLKCVFEIHIVDSPQVRFKFDKFYRLLICDFCLMI